MALVATRPTPRTIPRLSLTAAASERSIAPGTSRLNVQAEAWQDRMWHFYDHLGAVHYGVTFKRNAASKVSYFAAEINEEDPDQGPVETKNQQVIDAVDRLHSGYGDINEIVAELMILINLLGEGYLVGVDGVEGEEWDVWSIEEVRDSQFAAFLELEPDRVTADDGAFACRIWRPHPRHRHKADAPLRPVAEQCEQLLLLEDSISAAAKSRLAAGFLLVPSEFDIGDGTSFEDQVIAVLTTPIKDSESASRWAPGLIRGPSEHLDKLRVLSFAREIDEKFAGMREELTRAIAAGLDLPAEIILGKGDLNHWTGWDIDESAFRDHIDPDIILILDSITRGYLQPALIEGGMGVEEAARFLIWRDLSDLGQQPPTIAEALEMHAAGTVDDQYIRDLAGVHDDYIPDEPPPPEIVEVPAPGLPMPIPQGPPVQQEALVATARGRPLTELSNIDRRLLDRILEASEAAFNRVLERAGAKIRSHARKDRAISLSIDRLPNDQVTRHLGEKLTAQLQITPSELVPPDSFDPLMKRLRVIMDGAAQEVEATLETLTGIRPTLDAPRIQRALGHYVTQLEGFSVKLLFNPLDAGPGEVGDSVVPQGMVMDMMTVASGGKPSEGPSDVRGFATGQESLDFLEKNGYTPTGHLWEYGDSSTRQRPFPPHRRLDGTEFTDWDSEELATPPSASFLNVGHMFPGDHYRCQCATVPLVIEPAQPTEGPETSGDGEGIGFIDSALTSGAGTLPGKGYAYTFEKGTWNPGGTPTPGKLSKRVTVNRKMTGQELIPEQHRTEVTRAIDEVLDGHSPAFRVSNIEFHQSDRILRDVANYDSFGVLAGGKDKMRINVNAFFDERGNWRPEKREVFRDMIAHENGHRTESLLQNVAQSEWATFEELANSQMRALADELAEVTYVLPETTQMVYPVSIIRGLAGGSLPSETFSELVAFANTNSLEARWFALRDAAQEAIDVAFKLLNP